MHFCVGHFVHGFRILQRLLPVGEWHRDPCCFCLVSCPPFLANFAEGNLIVFAVLQPGKFFLALLIVIQYCQYYLPCCLWIKSDPFRIGYLSVVIFNTTRVRAIPYSTCCRWGYSNKSTWYNVPWSTPCTEVLGNESLFYSFGCSCFEMWLNKEVEGLRNVHEIACEVENANEGWV